MEPNQPELNQDATTNPDASYDAEKYPHGIIEVTVRADGVTDEEFETIQRALAFGDDAMEVLAELLNLWLVAQSVTLQGLPAPAVVVRRREEMLQETSELDTQS